jgi:hypothetical protein
MRIRDPIMKFFYPGSNNKEEERKKKFGLAFFAAINFTIIKIILFWKST